MQTYTVAPKRRLIHQGKTYEAGDTVRLKADDARAVARALVEDVPGAEPAPELSESPEEPKTEPKTKKTKKEAS